MIDNENWYFDNMTEAIIYGSIKDSSPWLEIARRTKKEAIIRKMANDVKIDTATLPAVLGKAIDQYRLNR